MGQQFSTGPCSALCRKLPSTFREFLLGWPRFLARISCKRSRPATSGYGVQQSVEPFDLQSYQRTGRRKNAGDLEFRSTLSHSTEKGLGGVFFYDGGNVYSNINLNQLKN